MKHGELGSSVLILLKTRGTFVLHWNDLVQNRNQRHQRKGTRI